VTARRGPGRGGGRPTGNGSSTQTASRKGGGGGKGQPTGGGKGRGAAGGKGRATAGGKGRATAVGEEAADSGAASGERVPEIEQHEFCLGDYINNTNDSDEEPLFQDGGAAAGVASTSTARHTPGQIYMLLSL
jgi:hypothetical protein